MIELGFKVRDIVSGIEGIVTARVEYLNGCVQYCVNSKVDKDGNMPKSHYIDDGQLEIVDEGVSVRQSKTGGSMPDTPPTSYKG